MVAIACLAGCVCVRRAAGVRSCSHVAPGGSSPASLAPWLPSPALPVRCRVRLRPQSRRRTFLQSRSPGRLIASVSGPVVAVACLAGCACVRRGAGARPCIDAAPGGSSLASLAPWSQSPALPGALPGARASAEPQAHVPALTQPRAAHRQRLWPRGRSRLPYRVRCRVHVRPQSRRRKSLH